MQNAKCKMQNAYHCQNCRIWGSFGETPSGGHLPADENAKCKMQNAYHCQNWPDLGKFWGNSPSGGHLPADENASSGVNTGRTRTNIATDGFV